MGSSVIKKLTIREVEKLGTRIDFERLVKRRRFTVYDSKLRISRFAEKPSVERIELEWIPPLVYVTARLKIGRYRFKIPVLAFDIDLEKP